MKTSPAGRALITRFEGERLQAYLCPAGILTIGVGHTGPDVKPGLTITRERSQQLLATDLQRFEGAVNRLGGRMNQGQFDAMVSFAFNVGEAALRSSTLLKKHLAGDYAGAAREFARWNKGGGKVLPGLVKRRAAEAALYMS
ncbi:lysozyme [Sphingobium yanoikuyae]|uniref:lysozyme n=1 Tax=Sphingobium yanoikuyae TaxID=13690 RepID=UPI0013DF5B0A